MMIIIRTKSKYKKLKGINTNVVVQGRVLIDDGGFLQGSNILKSNLSNLIKQHILHEYYNSPL